MLATCYTGHAIFHLFFQGLYLFYWFHFYLSCEFNYALILFIFVCLTFFFSFAKVFRPLPEVACFLVSHSLSLVCFPLFTNISPIWVLSSGWSSSRVMAPGYKTAVPVVCMFCFQSWLSSGCHLMSSRCVSCLLISRLFDKPLTLTQDCVVKLRLRLDIACSPLTTHGCHYLQWPVMANFVLR